MSESRGTILAAIIAGVLGIVAVVVGVILPQAFDDDPAQPTQPPSALVTTTAPTTEPVIVGNPTPSATLAPTPTPNPAILYSTMSSGWGAWTGSEPSFTPIGDLLVTNGKSAFSYKIAPIDPPPMNDFAVEADIQAVHACVSFGLITRIESTEKILNGSQLKANGGYWGVVVKNNEAVIMKNVDGGISTLDTSEILSRGAYAIDDAWHTYRLEAQGTTIRLLVDGTLITTVTDNSYPTTGQVGIFDTSCALNIRRFEVTTIT